MFYSVVYIVDKCFNGAEDDDMHRREDPEVARDLQLAIDLPEFEEVKASGANSTTETLKWGGARTLAHRTDNYVWAHC